MKKLWFAWAFLCAGLLSLLQPSAVLSQPKAPSQPYVVLVGIDDYQDKQIVDRVHAEADARALYDLFANKNFLGVDAQHIKLLLGDPKGHAKSELASRKNIMDALTWLAQNAKKDDPAFFVFFGQGTPMPASDRSCYFAVDSTFKNRNKDAIASGDIEQTLSKLESQRFAVFLDVNFKGFDIGKEKAPDPDLSGFYREFLGQEDSDAEFSRVVFMANSGLEKSLNLDKHGLFAQVVLDGLSGGADQFGGEPDGLITVEELAKYIRTELPDKARTHGKTDEEKGQTPIVLEGQSHDFVMDHNPKVYDKVQESLKTFADLAKNANLPKDIVEEGESLLFRMPKLEAKRDLRKAFQSFVKKDITADALQTKRNDILASMKLSDRDAAEYASMVIRATQVVQAEYVAKTNQGELVDHAIRGLFKEIHEDLPSSIGDRLENAKNLREVELVRLLTNARLHLGAREDLEKGNDITASLRAMLGKLDRHTDYIDPETLERWRVQLTGNFTGIGVQIRKNSTKDMLQVVTPIIGSPAYKAGMYAGDIITKIIRDVDEKGTPLAKQEVLSTKGMTTAEAVKKIVGEPGTKVKLIIERDGVEKPLEFELIRGRVEVETVMGHKRKNDDSWDYVIDAENKICYVRLSEFSTNTKRDLTNVMKELSKTGIKGFILDLRFNPGGLLDSAVQISDLFIEDGMIVTIKPRQGPHTSYVGKSDGSYLTFPMVCLVNGYSASGSEIVSACLQDHERAIVIGTRSYGKGSVQTIHPFATGGRLKMTTATFWRPNNKNLNKPSTGGKDEEEWGVKPNKGFNIDISKKELNELQDFMRKNELIQRPDRAKEIPSFTDRQLDSALQYLRGQIQTASKEKTPKAGVNN